MIGQSFGIPPFPPAPPNPPPPPPKAIENGKVALYVATNASGDVAYPAET